MFADIKGSMDLAEQLDPEEWHEILDRFFEILGEGVHRFEGTINQYTGDGIMALFGAPIAHEDHAHRACYAALHLRDTAREYANAVRAKYGVPFGVRIGLNSGAVVVGKIGDDLRMDYTAQGHTVGLAQRMEALAESGHICLTEYTHQLVEGYFELEDLGPTKVKGASEDITIFDLTGVGSFRTRLDRSRAMGLSRFVGREDDTAVLENALQRAMNGEGQVVGVVADAGTGKSRLCSEFLDTCRAQGMTIYEGRGVAHGAAIPMLPMMELWRDFYQIGEDDSAENARAKIAGRLLLMDDSYRESLPLLFDLLGVSDPDNPSPSMDAETRQKKLHNLVKRILHDPTNTTTTRIVLLEDLHWFDEASDSFLATTVESVSAGKDLWIVNFRPEYKANWLQRSYYHHLPLQPLSPEAIRELLHDHLGDYPSTAKLPESIHEQTKGNPFFIEEVVQSLVENGHLTGSKGAYVLTTPIESLNVPPTVQALLAARIDRLAEREKRVLQTASIIGKIFTEEILQQVCAEIAELNETNLSEALSELVKSEFLFESALYPKLEYSFKHPLTQEVAQGSQLNERKIKVHAAVAHAIESSGGNLDERAAEIGMHREEADQPEAAARWYRKAAEWSGISDMRESVKNWRKVRTLLLDKESSPELDALLLMACNEILSVGWRTGGATEEIESVFEHGRALVEKGGDPVALALINGRYGLARLSLSGSATDYVRYSEEAARIIEGFDNPGLRAAIWSWCGHSHMHAGNAILSRSWAEKILDEVGTNNQLGTEFVGYSPRAGLFMNLGLASVIQGQLEKAETEFAEGVRIGEEAGDLEATNWGCVGHMWLVLAKGRDDSRLNWVDRALQTAETLDTEAYRAFAYSAAGVRCLVNGQLEEARDTLRRSEKIMRDSNAGHQNLMNVLSILSQAYRALGEITEAIETARDGALMGRRGGTKYYEALAQIALAAALTVREGTIPVGEIETVLQRAEYLVNEMECESLKPQIKERYGRLATAQNNPSEAERILHEALEGYTSIGATGHAERLAKELES